MIVALGLVAYIAILALILRSARRWRAFFVVLETFVWVIVLSFVCAYFFQAYAQLVGAVAYVVALVAGTIAAAVFWRCNRRV